ncbi:hypothetical protein ZIOFF_007818 [Zingiber officinale]|uniref:Cation/H+ exchanger transmembrane domain-containing protein n=1 Tax=Zingiber officinale TaxID=94328 RepID=A0A8J5LT92_ZINOF|nr:hypothetical protein ZIOFF_007818 [Zingiber officinale]
MLEPPFSRPFSSRFLCLFGFGFFGSRSAGGRRRTVAMELSLLAQLHERLQGLVLTTSDHTSVVSINLFVTLLCGCIIIGHLLEENRWMNESITALVIGVFTGFFILLVTKGKSSHIFIFSEDLFFIYLLPPIIFNAGFQVKKKQFFHNFMTIILFGAVGTLISFFIISIGAIASFRKMEIISLEIRDFLAIAAIFSATDSVCTLQVLNQDETPLLYSLVFGEGVVNDATSVVLFNAIQNFDYAHIDANIILKHSTDREVALMILMAYLSYMLAELLSLSGILTVFFCGIVMSHYTWHNVTESSRVTTKHVFATLSFISETFLFLYVGMDAMDIEKWKFVSDSPGKSIAISSILLGLVLVGRAAFIFPLSFLSNLTKKSPDERIQFKQQITIWWAGLMRGAVSIALAYNQFARSGHTQLRGNAFMITSTITVVLFSTVVFGLMTKPLVRFLLPHNAKPTMSISSEPSTPSSLHAPLLYNLQGTDTEAEAEFVHRGPGLRMLLSKPSHTVHHYWRKFDNAFMRPVFGGRGFVPFFPASPPDEGLQGLP